ncbi:hypothetical protein MRB53_035195 [Persea americana]|uniref:Uncharacterized protein n=1 Tax=Persea americana TaxID=3435 RepID=A0ACC2K4I2_PERAE|nr:hypothetical protein MRB53_035195 [Persea americana]
MAFLRDARKLAPHGSMIIVQLSTATYIILSNVILTRGISSIVFLLYQFTLATIFTAALAFIFERKDRPPITKTVLCWTFSLALIGVTVSQNLLSASLYYISSSIEAAVLNMIPVFTYILTIVSRQEKFGINTNWGRGKLIGTLISVSGALTLMLWQSSAISLLTTSLTDWVLGLVMVVVGVLTLSIWILLLKPATIRYPAECSMNALMFLFASLQTSVLAAAASHEASQWQLKWDLELVNIVFGAVFYCGLANLFITWCAGMKGPIFVASFPPLGLVFTTIFETVFLGEALHVGSIVGSIMIVVGLYIYLWSKAKEEEYNQQEGYEAITP